MYKISFEHKAYHVLLFIANYIEENDPDGDVDVDLDDGILTITNMHGVFVMHKNSAIHEVWLSSPLSGPYHFRCLDDQWKTHDNILLVDVIRRELNVKFDGFEIA